jgi:methane monooxygenase component A beta chain/propane monooxygenase small subunit
MSSSTVTEARDFTYITPQRRKLSEYEAVNLHVQPGIEAGGWDQEHGYLRTPEGRYAWTPDSTALRHHNWYAFRDPANLWQRTYVRMQAEQERAIGRLSEDVVENGSAARIDPAWLTDIVAGHYAVWAYVEWGLFRSLFPAFRESLSDTLSASLLFNTFDRVRHSQDIVSMMLVLEEAVPDFAADDAKRLWLEEPRYQPLRKLIEELIFTVHDWAEKPILVNLVFDPILSEIGLFRLMGRQASFHGDALSQLIISSVDRDRRRNLAWTKELVAMVTADDVADAPDNREVIQQWLDRWTPRVIEAAEALAPLYELESSMSEPFAEVLADVRAQHSALITDLGFQTTVGRTA